MRSRRQILRDLRKELKKDEDEDDDDAEENEDEPLNDPVDDDEALEGVEAEDDLLSPVDEDQMTLMYAQRYRRFRYATVETYRKVSNEVMSWKAFYRKYAHKFKPPTAEEVMP
eukprot:gene3392-2173_t